MSMKFFHLPFLHKNDFEPYLNYNEEMNTKCKVGFVSVLNGGLEETIRGKVWDLIGME